MEDSSFSRQIHHFKYKSRSVISIFDLDLPYKLLMRNYVICTCIGAKTPCILY